jgi:lysozyme
MSKIFRLILLLITITLSSATVRAEDFDHHGKGRPAKRMPDAMPDAMPAQAPIQRGFKAATALDNHTPNINNKYKEGIDVSRYQGTIDWQKVAESEQISYVYLKATEGETLLDKTYLYNLKAARQVGLSVGSYHFYSPNISWEKQFKNLTRNVDKKTQDLVPMIDIEVRGNVSATKFIQDLKLFIEQVEAFYGKKPLLYTYQNFYNQHLVGDFKDYHWMMAKYKKERPKLTDNRGYIMWQYSATGRIPGINGDVDRSRIMGNYSLSELKM